MYNVPGNPKLKVRVFVHNPRPESKLSLVLTYDDRDSSVVVPSVGWKLPASVVIYRLNPTSAPSSVGLSLSTIAEKAFSTGQAQYQEKFCLKKIQIHLLIKKDSMIKILLPGEGYQEALLP